MRYAVLCIVLLAICEPILVDAKKLVFLVPRQVRRSPSSGWRPNSGQMKSTVYGSHDHHHHVPYRGPQNYIYQERKPAYRGPPFPHGGDNFDQGHEHVNHVHIPYGKDVTTVTTFGKGYIPYEYIKGPFSVAGERFQFSSMPPMSPVPSVPLPLVSKPTGPDFPPAAFPATGSHQEYVVPQSSAYTSQQQNVYVTGPDSTPAGQKIYTSRSIDKDVIVDKTQRDSVNSAIERDKEPVPRATDIFKDVSQVPEATQGAVILPSGIPSATIGDSKEGIVLRDSVFLDDYHRKVEELMKNWPVSLIAGGSGIGQTAGFQQHQLIEQYPMSGMAGSSFPGANAWLSDFAQSKQGYAVKEDLMEPPHDFRTMPIQTTPFHPVPLGVSFGLPSPQGVHG